MQHSADILRANSDADRGLKRLEDKGSTVLREECIDADVGGSLISSQVQEPRLPITTGNLIRSQREKGDASVLKNPSLVNTRATEGRSEKVRQGPIPPMAGRSPRL